jgi:hypothetical protein
MIKTPKITQLSLEITASAIGDNFMNVARHFREAQDAAPEEFHKLVKKTGIGLRKAYYLAAIDRRFRELGVSRDRLSEIGWTKVMLLTDHITHTNCEELLQLAESSSVRELTLKLRKEATLDGSRCVALYLTPKEYVVFRDVLLAHGATQRGRGLMDKEEALISALRALQLATAASQAKLQPPNDL